MLFLIFYTIYKDLYVLSPDFLDRELPSFSVLMDEDKEYIDKLHYQCILA
ncbi:hypothetical protein RintRC_7531 [Richelia intracellularis]|nr:hypothetical protein RintRC_7531 [Richelia intracellularis]